ncbi:MAG: acetyltransferase, gnat family [Osedax symbiont Rs1]|nr:MAG: acetyltransferase, gnat family [Osedax symbiont Rs1]
MKIALSRLKAVELESAFEIFKTYMKPIIEDAFGWDDIFQKNGFQGRLEPEWFSWILFNEEKVGLLCSRLKEDSLHIHLLIIFTQVQKQGLATLVTNKLRTEAHNQQLPLTLSCFKNNQPALNLYKKLGYTVNSEDEFFYEFISTVKLTVV